MVVDVWSKAAGDGRKAQAGGSCSWPWWESELGACVATVAMTCLVGGSSERATRWLERAVRGDLGRTERYGIEAGVLEDKIR